MTDWYLPEERAMLALRRLYRAHGYLPFRMNKFEEYDLYAASKDFLVSDSMITFTDRSGRLLALKPDVTLSIVRNYTYRERETEKICYFERVYRPGGSTHEYREIPQTGIECIGEIDALQMAEVTALAVQSLRQLGGEYALQLSHMGILSALLREAGADEACSARIIECLQAKNSHDLRAICADAAISSNRLECLTELHGAPNEVLGKLKNLSNSADFLAAAEELAQLCSTVEQLLPNARICLDFSIAQNLRYYSGIVFQGYLSGISEPVLSGGRYDPLLRKLGKKGSAIGFAVYLDRLAPDPEEEWDADVLVVYDDDADAAAALQDAEGFRTEGAGVMIARVCPEKLRFGKTVHFMGEKKEI